MIVLVVGCFPFDQTFQIGLLKNLGSEWNGVFRLTVTDLKRNPFHSPVFN